MVNTDSVGTFEQMSEQNRILKDSTISVFEKEIWNAAIEAAALKSTSAIGYETKSSLGSHVACEIRKLKK